MRKMSHNRPSHTKELMSIQAAEEVGVAHGLVLAMTWASVAVGYCSENEQMKEQSRWTRTVRADEQNHPLASEGSTCPKTGHYHMA
jgi:hypothetical protein